jgi:hypothetical protein
MCGRHAKAQHSAADLLGHPFVDQEAQTEELDGDLWRPDVIDDELEVVGVPGTKEGKVELQER